jgi:hypothetical protein
MSSGEVGALDFSVRIDLERIGFTFSIGEEVRRIL